VKIYLMGRDDWDYDEVTWAVVLAESEEQAVKLANDKTPGEWVVDRVEEINEAKVINEYIHAG
jgi:hypothetical protein